MSKQNYEQKDPYQIELRKSLAEKYDLDFVGIFDPRSLAIVKIKSNNRWCWNFMDKQGNFLSENNFLDVNSFDKKFAVVEVKPYQFNLIDSGGKLILDQNYREINSKESEKFYITEEQRENPYYGDYDSFFNLVDKKTGEFLFKSQNIRSIIIEEKTIMFKDHMACYICDYTGNILHDGYMSDIEKFQNGFAVVRHKDKYNLMDKQGKLYLIAWIDERIIRFIDGLVEIYKNGITYYIDKTGKKIFKG